MKSLLAMLVSLFSAAQPFNASDMQFSYEPVEGEAPSQCLHKQISDLPDWSVSCVTPYGQKFFTAHVVVREYPKNGSTGLEILYWVTEPGTKPIFHSTSALLNLQGGASLANFSLSQGVENDFASLVLQWKHSGKM